MGHYFGFFPRIFLTTNQEIIESCFVVINVEITNISV